MLDGEAGEFRYTPNDGFVGTDTFTYWVTDGLDNSEPATVAVDVTNAVPFAASQSLEYGTAERIRAETVDGRFDTIEGQVGATDDDPHDSVTFELAEGPESGELDFNSITGYFTYTPGEDFNGLDQFTYVANDGISDSQPAVVTIDSLDNTSPLVLAALSSITGSLQKEFGESPGDEDDVYLARFYLASLPDGVTGSVSAEIITPPQIGVLEQLVENGQLQLVFKVPVDEYDPDTTPPPQATVRLHNGNLVSKPFLIFPSKITGWPLFYPFRFAAHVDEATPLLDVGTSNGPAQIITQAEYGTVNVVPDSNNAALVKLVYTPKYDPSQPASETNQPHIGWDFFEFSRTQDILGVNTTIRQWVQVNVGGEVIVPEFVPPEPPDGQPPLFSGTGYFATRDSVEEAENRLKLVFLAVAELGNAKETTKAANTPDSIDAAMQDEASATRRVEQAYAGYLNQFEAAQQQMADYLKSLYVTSYYARKLTERFHHLPVSVNSLKASSDYLQKLLGGSKEYTDAAAVLIDSNTATIRYAENSHKILATVSAGGLAVTGAGAVLFTLERVAVREGLRAFAKEAAVIATTAGLAWSANHYVTGPLKDKMNLSDEQWRLVGIGMSAFQSSKAVTIFSGKVAAAVSKIFRAPLKSAPGKMLEFPGIKATSRVFNIRSKEEYDRMEAVSDAAKTAWVKSLADDPVALTQLKRAGVKLDPATINAMRVNGTRPEGFDVHHKDPLQFGGSNDPSNFILMQNKDSQRQNFHGALSNYQKSLTRNFPANETTFETQWPVFDGIIYPH